MSAGVSLFLNIGRGFLPPFVSERESSGKFSNSLWQNKGRCSAVDRRIEGGAHSSLTSSQRSNFCHGCGIGLGRIWKWTPFL
ncbi:hypothetical protein SLA2020_476260 [Shorea laevis]